MKLIHKTIEDSLSAKLLKNGINCAIVGKPNVGKSSLLNALVKENKAIVTNIPGTTRDIIEASVNLKHVTLNLIDTAGIRNTYDEVEQIGVRRAKEITKKADIILFVLDGSSKFEEADQQIYELIKNKKHLVIVNKADLKKQINLKINIRDIYHYFA